MYYFLLSSLFFSLNGIYNKHFRIFVRLPFISQTCSIVYVTTAYVERCRNHSERILSKLCEYIVRMQNVPCIVAIFRTCIKLESVFSSMHGISRTWIHRPLLLEIHAISFCSKNYLVSKYFILFFSLVTKCIIIFQSSGSRSRRIQK